MKTTRIFLLLITLSFASVSSGQRITDKQKALSRNMPILRVGASLDTWNGTDVADASIQTLYDVAFNYQWCVSKVSKSTVFFTPEFALGTRGFKEGQQNYWTYHTSLQSHNLRLVPIQMSFQPKVGYGLWLDVHAGGFVSYDYAGYHYTQQYFSSDEKTKLSDLDKFHRWDSGVQVGVGLWFYDFNIDVTFRHGFIDIFPGIHGLSNNFVLRLGYAFQRRPKNLPPGMDRWSMWE